MKPEAKLKLPDKDPIPINELARVLDVHVSTVFRWGSPRGVRGQRLRLLRLGGRTYVERAAWDAFVCALNSPSADTAKMEAQQAGDQPVVDAELDAAGF